ncbi:MAG: short-chain fatty acid transporter [Flavobacteriaceae bacterium]
MQKLGQHFTDLFKRYMPDAFVFALILTFVVAFAAWSGTSTSPVEILEAWYRGFWGLLEFGMQMTLLIVTGYAIALSPLIDRQINVVATKIKHPTQVYLIVIYFGLFASLVSWGWVVIAAVLGRALAKKVANINYPFLIACAYLSKNIWSTGLSSSIPLLLNTEGNYLIKAGLLETTIPSSSTLGSPLNLGMIVLYLIVTPLLMLALRPRSATGETLAELCLEDDKPLDNTPKQFTSYSTFSDRLNHSRLLVLGICLSGTVVVGNYFWEKGFDLNLNLMIFIFLLLGMALHQTPLHYGQAVQKASNNVSSILYQFPFYAGIMGIMIHSGLATQLASLLSAMASVETLASYAFVLGGLVNFAIPSGGGEFAVIGPSLLEAVQVVGAALPEAERYALQTRTILALTYGESLTNLLQPFFILMVLPIMAAGTKLQARDVMGYLVIPFVVLFFLQLVLINLLPVS